MFRYCMEILGYSEQAAYKRIQAARAARSHPAVLESLWRGEIHLAAIVILAPHFRTDNLHVLLAAARGKSKQDLETLAAGFAPRPDVREMIRALPLEPPAAIPIPEPVTAGPRVIEEDREPSQAASRPAQAATAVPSRGKIEALSPGRFLFRFTGNSVLRAKYTRATELTRHPAGRRMEAVFEAALDSLLDRLDPERRLKRREARGSRSRASRTRTRKLPQALRDDVWSRDGGRCTFVNSDGARCPAVERLEIDHVRPYALGGPSEIENLRLLCRAHNLLMARRVFGPNYPRG